VAGRSSHGEPEQTAPSRRQRPPEQSQPQRSQPRGGLAAIPLYVWFLGFLVVVLLLTVGALWTVYALRGQWTVSGPTPTPIIWTPSAQAVPPTMTPVTPEPVAATPTAPTGIAIGGYVRVVGTEGSGLSLRDGPGTNYQRMDIAIEGEVFEVVDGPVSAGGVEWWKIRDPKNEARSWWAASNFLQPTEKPGT
jgi:hypothetical protein